MPPFPRKLGVPSLAALSFVALVASCGGSIHHPASGPTTTSGTATTALSGAGPGAAQPTPSSAQPSTPPPTPTTPPPTLPSPTLPSGTTPAGAQTTTATAPAATGAPGANLAAGTYVDGPASQPHYLVTVTNNVGEVSFIYQNGRRAQAGSFTATVSSGKLSAHFSGGQTLNGTMSAGTFSLTGCQAVLRFAIQAHSCTFTLQGA